MDNKQYCKGYLRQVPQQFVSYFSTYLSTNYFAGVLPLPSDATCEPWSNLPIQHRPAVFWFFTQDPQPTLDAVLCAPDISVWDVIADVDLHTKKVTRIEEVDSLIPKSNASSHTHNPVYPSYFLGNISSYPMYGHAYNGLFFDWNITDSTVQERLDGLQAILPATIYRAAKLGGSNSSDGSSDAFLEGYVGYANQVYVSGALLKHTDDGQDY